jgi:hypothetical protein
MRFACRHLALKSAANSCSPRASASAVKSAFFTAISCHSAAEITLHTTTAGEPARTVTSLTQIESENGLSRIYGGIHFAFDNSAGQALGKNVANYVLANGPHANP